MKNVFLLGIWALIFFIAIFAINYRPQWDEGVTAANCNSKLYNFCQDKPGDCYLLRVAECDSFAIRKYYMNFNGGYFE